VRILMCQQGVAGVDADSQYAAGGEFVDPRHKLPLNEVPA
jgi:hypothetical protein